MDVGFHIEQEHTWVNVSLVARDGEGRSIRRRPVTTLYMTQAEVEFGMEDVALGRIAEVFRRLFNDD